MTKYELRKALNTTDRMCEDFCLYDLLECESEEDFETAMFCAEESMRIEIYYLQRTIDALHKLNYQEVQND